MIRKGTLLIGFFLLSAVLMACAGEQGDPGQIGPAGPAGPQGPAGPPGQDANVSLDYVGDEKCAQCHEDAYTGYRLSGHPHNLKPIIDGQEPEFPYDNLTGGVNDPPPGYTWEDISYVIGGFAWKALFVDQNGYVITGGEEDLSQWNFDNDAAGLEGGWAPHHPGEQIVMDCAQCHSTGFRAEGRQGDLEGIVGTWDFAGVQCEACHGAGSLHASDPYGQRMVIDRSNQLCGECHSRLNPAHIDAADGFSIQNTQYDQLFNSQHFALQCIACHDPHASSVYADEQVNPDKGIRQVCESCHWEQTYQNSERHLALDCIDCHMPPAGQSALASQELYVGDLSAHLFSINTDPEAPQFNEDGTLSMPYLTLPYACGHCHNGEYASVRTVDEWAAQAQGYHTPPLPVLEPSEEVPAELEATPEP
jgi:hypothetical protein